MFLFFYSGLSHHVHPGFPVAGVFLRLGQRPAEREGRHEHGGDQLHVGRVQGRQRDLRGDGVRQPADPQHLCGKKENGNDTRPTCNLVQLIKLWISFWNVSFMLQVVFPFFLEYLTNQTQ